MKKPGLDRLLYALSVLALATAPFPARAATASLVRDINVSGSRSPYADPSKLMIVQGKVFFSAEEPSTGRELWVSDGTEAGTTLLADACPGTCDGTPHPLGTLGNILFWAAETGPSGLQIWRSDGTRPGTWPITLEKIQGSIDIYDQLNLTSVLARGKLYFPACTAEAGCELWSSDGTREGTRIVKDLVPGEDGSRILGLSAAGDRILFFRAAADAESWEPWEAWVTDGTAVGTHAIASLPREPFRTVAAGGRLFFVVRSPEDGQELWTSDGTGPGTRPVTQFAAPSPFDGAASAPLLTAGNLIYFLANDVLHGVELWRSDGTPAGTRRITEFGAPEPFDTSGASIVPLGDRVVFLADDGLTQNRLWVTRGAPESTVPLPVPCGASGCFGNSWYFLLRAGSRAVFWAADSLWSTDGTPGGTVRILESCNGSCPVLADRFAEVSGALYFLRSDFPSDEIWRTDGTKAGTRQVVALPDDISVRDNSMEIALAGPRIFFCAVDNRYGSELWVADAEGVRMVADAAVGGASSQPQELTAYRDRLFFSASDGTRRVVWESAGTPETTVPVVGTEPYGFSDLVTHLTPAGPWLFFTRERTFYDWSLWRTDSTAAGLVQLTPDLTISQPLVAHGGAVYFLGRRRDLGEDRDQIWKSDGTPGGTAELLQLPQAPGDFPRQPRFLTSAGSEMYLITESRTKQLWRSDGTAQGTHMIFDFDHTISEDPQFTRAGAYVYFIGGSLDHGIEVWRTDGTEQGTALTVDADGTFQDSRPSDLTEFQGSLYFFALTPSRHRGLWRTDGTPAGSSVLKEFDFRHPAPTQLTAAAGRLFFVNDDGTHGAELWQSDGTTAGTRLVRDIRPGPLSSRISGLTAAGGRLWFAADDGLHGAELWQSDGTEAGTRMVQDLAPMALSSAPEQLTAVGDRLYFTADDGATGREVWSLPLSGPTGCQPSATRLCLNGGRFQVEATWRDFQGNTGAGRATSLTGDTGYFWFFDPSNVEAVVKVLDGRGLNNHFWVFYGALSNVEYTLTVTDTQTGLTRRYFNPAGRLASVGDTRGFGPLGAYSRTGPPASPSSPLISERTAAATGSCQPSATRLCLRDGRFAVEASWKDFQGKTGQGQAVSLTGDTGYFWFFDSANVEVVLKVLDGTPVNGKHWVFYGALSSVEYTLTVTDTQTGKVKTYKNQSGRFASAADTSAF